MSAYHVMRRGFSVILGAIVILGLVKEAIDASRLGWHHTSMQAKVRAPPPLSQPSLWGSPAFRRNLVRNSSQGAKCTCGVVAAGF